MQIGIWSDSIDLILHLLVAFGIGWVASAQLSRRTFARLILSVVRGDRPPERFGLPNLARHMAKVRDDAQTVAEELTREQSLQTTVFDLLPSGVLILSDEGRILSLNRSAERIFPSEGITSVGNSIRVRIWSPDIIRIFEEACLNGSVEWQEIGMLGRSEQILRVSATCYSGDGPNRFVVLIVDDISEQRRAERARREFIGNISHELRTPITAIIATSEMLMEGVQDRSQEFDFLEVVRRNAERLNLLIKDLLILSRLDQESKTRPLRRQTSFIAELCDSAVQSAREGLQDWESRITITTAIDENVPTTVMIHRGLIHHAIVNLLDNAAKHLGDSGRIWVEVKRVGEYLEFSVIDDGCGIAEEHLGRIFERFYRVDSGRSRQNGGSGIGLAIVKNVAIAHGGTVKVHSVLGEGSTFTLVIPLLQN